MDPDGIKSVTMGRVSQFGWLGCCSLDSSMIKLVGRIFAHLGIHVGWMNSGNCLWWKNHHWSRVNHEVVWSSGEGAIDATNALVKEAQVALKNITSLDAFVNK